MVKSDTKDSYPILTVKNGGRIEFLSFVGFFGSFISGIQMITLEYNSLSSVKWSLPVVGFLVGFTCCLFTMYTLTPTMMLHSSAIVFNLSLLTSDVYAAVAAVFLFHQKFSIFYVVAFITTIVGIIFYNLHVLIHFPSCARTENIDGYLEQMDIDSHSELPDSQLSTSTTIKNQQEVDQNV